MELKSLLKNKFIWAFVIIAAALVLLNIRWGNDPVENRPLDLNDTNVLMEFVKKEISHEIEFALYGKFRADTTKRIIAAEEISNEKEWGIKFRLFDVVEDTVKQIYETILLDGSLRESQIVPLELTGINHNLLYYNSGNYFMGSGGGEVFAYIIDLEKESVNYGHLVLARQVPKGGLFLSPKNEKSISEFLTVEFKREYPGLRTIEKDIALE